MATTASRVRRGTLKLGTGTEAEQFEGQFSSIAVTVDNTFEDQIESLAGTRAPGGVTSQWNLVITAIQDFQDKAGLVAYSHEHNAEEVDCEFAPGGATGVKYAGKVTVTALNAGGDVGSTLTSDATWPWTDEPTRTYPASAAA